MKNRMQLSRLGLCVSLLSAPALASEGDAEYRHHVMEAVGGHMQAAADILRQKVPHQAHLSLHVDSLAELAEISPLLFPEGSEGGDALPAIWEEPDDFAARLDEFRQAARELKMAVDQDEGIRSAFQNLGQSCKSCHDDYRAE